ncbi:hypothetical protein NDU88_002085 [Pleurodeles waltl]|uniref:Uncharacterized protein n=1 Tax=Pleurodeles waltl TaxID=8319 RepID=A0AAV7LBG3_PLEWA|nr:hypothetical protein NDU88_002085 [Pleurodeles waltl]
MGRTKGKHTDGKDVPTSGDQEPAVTIDVPIDKLDVILQKIRESRVATKQRLGSITMELNILKDDQKKITDRLKQTPTNVASILPDHKEHTTAIEHLQHQVEALQERVEDAEGRFRRNNICVIGLPEGKEGRDATQYVEDWLRALTMVKLSIHFTIERAHRIHGRRPPPGAPPHPLIAKAVNYRDRDTLLQVVREKDPIVVNNTCVSLYPDYTLAVQR